MKINEAYVVYFSPTHTSQRVAKAIAREVEVSEVIPVDLTLEKPDETVLPASSLVVFAVPVYGGHVPPLAVERLKSLRGTSTPAVVVVVYGNRAYENALVELDKLVTSQGFKVIAGATFVGEHSYSTEAHPVAAGRPDAADLQYAADFGEKIGEKIEKAATSEELYGVDVRRIRRPKQPFLPLFRFLRKVIKLRKSGIPLPQAPSVEDENLCKHCGSCVRRCPTGAITAGDELHTDASKCIKCCACVKCCPHRARVYNTPFGVLLSECFKKQKLPQSIL